MIGPRNAFMNTIFGAFGRRRADGTVTAVFEKNVPEMGLGHYKKGMPLVYYIA